MSVSKKMMEFSRRASWIRKMFEEGAPLKKEFGAENVCDFSLGNPDLPPPARFHVALTEVAADERPGIHGYMPNPGYPQVREAVAAQLAKEQEVPVAAGDVLMTCGAAGALNVVLKAILDPGDEVLIMAPYFVEYGFYIDNHGGRAVVVEPGDDFLLDLGKIEAAVTERTKALIINSPNNPTGQIYPAAMLAELGELLRRIKREKGQTIYCIADEPYRKIVYDGHVVPSVMRAVDSAVVVSSYSKDLSLPGERIGYAAVHPHIDDKAALLDAMTLANRILGFVNAPALMQRVVARLQGATVDIDAYTRRRQLFCHILQQAGYAFTPPAGAFYIFPRSPLADDAAFVGLLQKERILAVPGRGFGMPGYFRLAFCVDEAVIERSAEGFARALAAAREAE